MKSIASWLSLPGGIHFRKLTSTWRREEDLSLTMGLVEECAYSLESLDIAHNIVSQSGISIRADNLIIYPVEPGSASVDPSNKTQRYDFSGQITERRMGRHGTQNN